MLPAAIGEDEVVEPVAEHLAGDSDAEAAGIGEIRQCHAPRLGALTEDHIPKAPGMGPRRAAPASPEPDVPQWARGAPDAVVSEALGAMLEFGG